MPLAPPDKPIEPEPPFPEVQAALEAERLFLVKSGWLADVWRDYPDANTRSKALKALMDEALKRRFHKDWCDVTVHITPTIITFSLEARASRNTSEPRAFEQIELWTIFPDPRRESDPPMGPENEKAPAG